MLSHSRADAVRVMSDDGTISAELLHKMLISLSVRLCMCVCVSLKNVDNH